MNRDRISEHLANEGLARGALPGIVRRLDIEATRRDWRAVLADRDAKRAHRSRRDARKHAAGRASVVGMVQALAVACVAILARWS